MFIIFSLLLIATIPVYIYIGYRLKENILLWGIMGLGFLLLPSIVCLLALYLFNVRFFLITRWPLVQCLSPVFALLVAGFMAYKKGLLTKTGDLTRKS